MNMNMNMNMNLKADELKLRTILQSIKNTGDNPQPIILGNIIIPGDVETFNQMWLAKAFDDIKPSDRLQISPLSMFRTCLHMGRYEWCEYFYKQRENLLHMSPYKIWKASEYYSYISINTINILKLTPDSRLTIWKGVKLSDLGRCNDDNDDDAGVISEYLLGPPERLMFPDDINEFENESDKVTIVYRHPVLTQLFREIVLRYQYLCNKSNEERINIYIDEINVLYEKIKFIQTIMYFGVKQTIYLFKKMQYNYLFEDPETREINQEPNEFQDISYKEALYKFYIYCISLEEITETTLEKIYFLGDVVNHYDDIRDIVMNCIIPLSSCVIQDKLKTSCCQIILLYLAPKSVKERYLMQKMAAMISP